MPLITELKQDCPICGVHQVRLIAYKHQQPMCIDCFTKDILEEYGNPKKIKTPYKYIEFHQEENIYKIWNTVYEKYVGEIRKERMGTWLHWHLFLYPDCGCTNGCLKEITRHITTLYSKK